MLKSNTEKIIRASSTVYTQNGNLKAKRIQTTEQFLIEPPKQFSLWYTAWFSIDSLRSTRRQS